MTEQRSGEPLHDCHVPHVFKARVRGERERCLECGHWWTSDGKSWRRESEPQEELCTTTPSISSASGPSVSDSGSASSSDATTSDACARSTEQRGSDPLRDGDAVTIRGVIEEVAEDGAVYVRFAGLGSKRFSMWFNAAHVQRAEKKGETHG